MNALAYFIGLGIALFIVNAWLGIFGCLALIALLVLIERGTA